ncbi:MAG TPA: TIGR02757 family protein [Flavisolibacter sp.]|nr:TIGR02757 family protein [Flavisolibacter sp.]
MNTEKLKDFLDKKVEEYNQPSFIEHDPVCIPHLFTRKEDIEIAGFFAAVFAWGNRTTIIKKSKELMKMMDDHPHDFITQHSERDLKNLLLFRHRTFNATDLLYFILFLKEHYRRSATLETAFIPEEGPAGGIEAALMHFHDYFFSLPDAPLRTRKHIATPRRHSTCKRLNMFLRWMVRKDDRGVDFGIWQWLQPAALICPIDVHVARVARRFGLIERKQVDWFTALELTGHLKNFDPLDPVKYDFALFGLGVAEKF